MSRLSVRAHSSVRTTTMPASMLPPLPLVSFSFHVLSACVVSHAFGAVRLVPDTAYVNEQRGGSSQRVVQALFRPILTL